MKPEKVEELIQNYLDMSLSSEQKSLLESYLEIHADSRVDLERYKKILGLLDVEDEIDPPENFTKKVMLNLPDVDFNNSRSGGFGSIFENLSSVVGAIGVAVAAVFLFAFANMESPFFKSNNVFRPQGQVIDVARTRNTDDSYSIGRHEGQSGVTNPAELSSEMSIYAIDGLVFLGDDPKRLKFINSGSSEILKPGHIIRTIGNAKIAYADDHTEIRLKPKTELKVIDHENFHLKHGDVWVEIRRKVDHFEIKTDHLVAAVRGTTFSVSSNVIDWNTVTTSRKVVTNPSSAVQVFEGKVAVRNIRGDKRTESLEMGEGVVFTQFVPTLKPYKLTQEEYQRWDEVIPSEDSGDATILNDETGPKNSFDKEVE